MRFLNKGMNSFRRNNLNKFTLTSKLNFYNTTKKLFSDNANNNKEATGLLAKIKKFGKFGMIFYSAYVTAGFITFYILLEYKYIKVEKVVNWFEDKGINKYIDIRKKVDEANPKL